MDFRAQEPGSTGLPTEGVVDGRVNDDLAPIDTVWVNGVKVAARPLDVLLSTDRPTDPIEPFHSDFSTNIYRVQPELEAVLMTLVDVPLVAPDTIRQLMRTWRRTGAPIVRPARGEEHGHPVLFDRRVFAELRAADPTKCAKPVVHAHAHELVNMPATDDGAFLDLDTPADYERALTLALASRAGALSD